MKVLKKVLVIGVVFISIYAIFSGYNSGVKNSIKTNLQPSDNLQKDTEQSVSRVKLMIPTFYLEENNKRSDFYAKLDIFKSKHKAVKEIQVDEVPWEQIMLKYTVSFNVNESPDILLAGDFAMRSNIQNKRFYPLNEFIDKKILDDWAPAYMKTISLDGNVYGYIRNTDVRVIYYNKDIFESSGLDSNQHPKTWDELQKYALKTNKVVSKDQYGYGFVGGKTMHTPIMWSILVLQQGADITDNDGKAIFDNPESIKAAQFYSDLINKYKVSPKSVLALDEELLLRGFLSNKFAMILGGSWQYAEMKKHKDIDLSKIGWFELPIPSGGRSATIGGFWAYCISSKSKNPKLAYELLSTIINEDEIKEEINNSEMWIPTRKSWAELDVVRSNSVLSGFTEYSQRDSQASILSNDPFELYRILNDALQRIWDGAPSEETLKQAANTFNSKYYTNKK